MDNNREKTKQRQNQKVKKKEGRNIKRERERGKFKKQKKIQGKKSGTNPPFILTVDGHHLRYFDI